MQPDSYSTTAISQERDNLKRLVHGIWKIQNKKKLVALIISYQEYRKNIQIQIVISIHVLCNYTEQNNTS